MERVKEQKNTLSTVFVDNGQAEGCMLKLFEMKNNKILCDVVINKGSTRVFAHSCVIAANCPLFSKLVLKDSLFSVNTPFSLELHSFTKCESNSELNCIICFSRIIDFFYTGKMTFLKSHLSHILHFCTRLQLDELYDACREFKGIRNLKESYSSKHKLALKQCNNNNNNTNNNKSKVKKILAKEDVKRGKSILQRQFDGKYITDSNYDDLSCRKCNLKFRNSKKHENHTKVMHGKHFICLSCSFTSYKLSYIVYHLSNMKHAEVHCSICLFEAKDEEALKLHLEDHKSDYPYKCYVCDFSFKTKQEWLRHMLIHKKEHNCIYCSSSFLSRAALNTHLSTHKACANYVCEICGFKATYKSILERHLSKHRKENLEHSSELFSCPVTPCPFTAVSKSDLKKHLLNHNIDKVYICDLCKMKFTHEKNLRRHYDTVHSTRHFIRCCRCDFKNARVDKAKKHCEKSHPNDSEAMRFVSAQLSSTKSTRKRPVKRRDPADITIPIKTDKLNIIKTEQRQKKEVEAQTTELEAQTTELEAQTAELKVQTSELNTRNNLSINDSHSEVELNSIKKSYLLSETSGEFHILSESEKIPLASFTSTNVLRIGNFREGTGSVTLNETTGVVTFNNINSESTGAVFLNESTGELSYINLGKESMSVNMNNVECDKIKEIESSLKELSSEINEDFLFDPFDMDIGNEDSCDGFDDLDGFLFDPIDSENSNKLDALMSSNDDETPKAIPHLNETTGELSFDYKDSKSNQKQLWDTSSKNLKNKVNLNEGSDESYRLLLNEFTGEFS